MKKTLFILLLIGTWVTCVAQKPIVAEGLQQSMNVVFIRGNEITWKGKVVKTQIRTEYYRGRKTLFYGVIQRGEFCPVLTVAEREVPTLTNYWAFK